MKRWLRGKQRVTPTSTAVKGSTGRCCDSSRRAAGAFDAAADSAVQMDVSSGAAFKKDVEALNRRLQRAIKKLDRSARQSAAITDAPRVLPARHRLSDLRCSEVPGRKQSQIDGMSGVVGALLAACRVGTSDSTRRQSQPEKNCPSALVAARVPRRLPNQRTTAAPAADLGGDGAALADHGNRRVEGPHASW